jgi:putative transposase
VEAGLLLKERCDRVGVAEATFYNWCAKLGGIEVADAKRLN